MENEDPVIEDLREPNSIPTTTGADASASGITWARNTPSSATDRGARFVLHSQSLDESDGPTHQPSVTPRYEPVRGQPTEYAPYESPQERNESDLDLYVNRAPAAAPPQRGGDSSTADPR